jgi:hypothetical protein
LRPPSSVDGIEVVVGAAAPTASTPARAIVGNRQNEAALRVVMIVVEILTRRARERFYATRGMG